MAHWGIAYASGPNYNLPWERYDPAGKEKALAASYDAMQAALAHADKATPVEQAMIKALPRPLSAAHADRGQSAWDKAYTREMRKIFARIPTISRCAAVFAESIMDETPWQMWDIDTGGATEGAGTRGGARRCSSRRSPNCPAAWDHPACCISTFT